MFYFELMARGVWFCISYCDDDGRGVVDASFSLELFVSLSVGLSLVNRLRKNPSLEAHPLLCCRADLVHAFARRLGHIVDGFMRVMDDFVSAFGHRVRDAFNLNNCWKINYQYGTSEVTSVHISKESAFASIEMAEWDH